MQKMQNSKPINKAFIVWKVVCVCVRVRLCVWGSIDRCRVSPSPHAADRL